MEFRYILIGLSTLIFSGGPITLYAMQGQNNQSAAEAAQDRAFRFNQFLKITGVTKEESVEYDKTIKAFLGLADLPEDANNPFKGAATTEVIIRGVLELRMDLWQLLKTVHPNVPVPTVSGALGVFNARLSKPKRSKDTQAQLSTKLAGELNKISKKQLPENRTKIDNSMQRLEQLMNATLEPDGVVTHKNLDDIVIHSTLQQWLVQNNMSFADLYTTLNQSGVNPKIIKMIKAHGIQVAQIVIQDRKKDGWLTAQNIALLKKIAGPDAKVTIQPKVTSAPPEILPGGGNSSVVSRIPRTAWIVGGIATGVAIIAATVFAFIKLHTSRKIKQNLVALKEMSAITQTETAMQQFENIVPRLTLVRRAAQSKMRAAIKEHDFTGFKLLINAERKKIAQPQQKRF